MSERQHEGYGKLELLPEPGDKFRILVDGKVVERGVPRREVPDKLREVLKEYE